MTKGKKGKKRSGGGESGATKVWDGVDHAERLEKQAHKKAKKQDKDPDHDNNDDADAPPSKVVNKVERRMRLTAKLTHDSREKREASKLRLNITKTQRDLDKLRQRLQKWDTVDEEKQLQAQRQKEIEAQQAPKKKKGRLGPETWKLKGPARPAWLVNEFDVRYVCPHQKAHDDFKVKAKRIQNLMVLYKGNFGGQYGNNTNDKKTDELSYPHRRQLLALLMQYGLLNMEAKKYKTARLAFLECLELDGITNPITNARCHLMRLYLQVNRPQSVHQLWTTRLASAASKERSVWVLYSVALVEYVRWKDFQEGSRKEAEEALVRAFRGNVFCAYYLAFADFFHEHMEYTDEIEDASDDSPLEEAIEYCDSDQMGMWMGTEGALEWVQNTLLRVMHQPDQKEQQKVAATITKADLDWNRQLEKVEKEHKAQQEAEAKDQQEQEDDKSSQEDDDDNESSDNEETDEQPEVDVLMFAGMYRTTMEMLEASGSMSRVPPMIVEDDANGTKSPEEDEEDST